MTETMLWWVLGILGSVLSAIGLTFTTWLGITLYGMSKEFSGMQVKLSSIDVMLVNFGAAQKERMDSIEVRLESRSDKWIPIIANSEMRIGALERRCDKLEHPA